MKILAAFGVMVALVSAMTFVGLYSTVVRSGGGRGAETQSASVVEDTSVVPSPDVTTGSAEVMTTVTVGGTPISTSVTITEE